jgi:hypothetical protein
MNQLVNTLRIIALIHDKAAEQQNPVYATFRTRLEWQLKKDKTALKKTARKDLPVSRMLCRY